MAAHVAPAARGVRRRAGRRRARQGWQRRRCCRQTRPGRRRRRRVRRPRRWQRWRDGGAGGGPRNGPPVGVEERRQPHLHGVRRGEARPARGRGGPCPEAPVQRRRHGRRGGGGGASRRGAADGGRDVGAGGGARDARQRRVPRLGDRFATVDDATGAGGGGGKQRRRRGRRGTPTGSATAGRPPRSGSGSVARSGRSTRGQGRAAAGVGACGG